MCCVHVNHFESLASEAKPNRVIVAFSSVGGFSVLECGTPLLHVGRGCSAIKSIGFVDRLGSDLNPSLLLSSCKFYIRILYIRNIITKTRDA